MKAIITDLDRTLLHTDKSLSRHTVEVLKKCREKGLRLMVASARPIRELIKFNQSSIPMDGITATNGAVVLTPDGIHQEGIPHHIGEAVLEKLISYPDVFLSVETDRGLYSNRDIPIWQPVVYDKFPKLPDGIILYKILASSTHKELYDNVASVLTAQVYHTVANNDLVQIMSNEATKWNGIKRMLAYYGISPKDAVYFGDDNDDIESIKGCGLGVAMANAIPAVLDAADVVTYSNDDDGVARFIEENIL